MGFDMLIAPPKVYVIIVNWNNWYDTIECLESLLRSNYPNFQVMVVDNGSSNDSVNYLRAWAEGKLDVAVSNHDPVKVLSFPPMPKPIPYSFYSNQTVITGQMGEMQASEGFVFIEAGENRGYAAGNNIAIKHIAEKADHDYIWLLNGDTVVEPDALKNLVQFAQERAIDICGSVLRYYYHPNLVQSYGGHIDKFFGTSSNILDADSVDTDLDYVIGASMLISRSCINIVGLLPEEYFLYYEETDYCFKARAHGLRLGVAKNSIVYHKEGGATGLSHDAAARSEFSDILILLNRAKFHKKYLGGGFGLWIGMLVSLGLRIKRGQAQRVVKVIKRLIEH